MTNLASCAAYAYTLAESAGKKILEHYSQPIVSQNKPDGSPITAADQASHNIIVSGLENFALDDQGPIPVLSEESPPVTFQERQQWRRYWCVDPLDGTREFIDRNDEFAVNIALIVDHQPVIGIIYIPTQQRGYLAWQGGGAYRQERDGSCERIHTQRPPQLPLRVLLSRHFGLGTSLPAWLPPAKDLILLHQGSALKFCTLACGQADIFFRFSATSEWDNAAGQCLLVEAGGAIFSPDWEPLTYNHTASLRHGNIIAVGDPAFDWLKGFSG
jgi:3'(2'), 5'-bisphosphate nucleotidase